MGFVCTFTLEHRSGKQHGNAVAMSHLRPPNPVLGVLQTLFANEDAFKTAQRAGSILLPVIFALANNSSFPSNKAPGLQHSFMEVEFCVENFVHHPVKVTCR